MPSDVDICNLALAHIGDSANIQSISPPDGSVQSIYCSKYYPVAVSALLELSTWGFSCRRATLPSVANPSTSWCFAYALPAEMVNAISVLAPEALDDYSHNFGVQDAFARVFPDFSLYDPAANYYEPRPYTIETDVDGNMILLTNQENAVLRFTVQVKDATKFSPLFVLALSYMLASMLAGPIIKGDQGRAVAADMLKTFQAIEIQAEASDATQRKTQVRQSVPWMAGR